MATVRLPPFTPTLKGDSYDRSYLESGKAEKGSEKFAVEHEGVIYYLTSAEQREKFKADEVNRNYVTKSHWGRGNTLKFPLSNYFGAPAREGSHFGFLCCPAANPAFKVGFLLPYGYFMHLFCVQYLPFKPGYPAELSYEGN